MRASVAVRLNEDKKEQLELIRRTHEIFVGIIGKEIELRIGDPPGRTDCETYVCIPPEDPQADLIHKHELQHCVFGSDLRARAEFVSAYVLKLTEKNSRLKPIETELKEFMHLYINALDDLRVCSLWEKPYPQSADDIRERWRRIVLDTCNYRVDLIHYTIALGLGLRVPILTPGSQWEPYEALIIEATHRVKHRGFVACLITAKWIMDQLLGDIVPMMRQEPTPPPIPGPQGFKKPRLAQGISGPARPPPTPDVMQQRGSSQEQQASTIVKMINGVSDKNPKTSMMDTDESPSDLIPQNYAKTRDMVSAAMGLMTDEQRQYLLKQSEHEMEQVIKLLRSGRSNQTRDDRLTKGILDPITFVDARRDQLVSTKLEESDHRVIANLKRKFALLMQRKKNRASESGQGLDPARYIDFINGSGDMDFFVEDGLAKGFGAMVLLDMSNSMIPKWRTIERACKVLALSMKFPFARLEVWGFSSNSKGKVNIFRFQDPTFGYDGNAVRTAWGATPLHIAIRVATRRVLQYPGKSQNLFVLTDGEPAYVSAAGTYHSKTLIAEVAKIVQEARYKNVNVSGLVVGDDVGDQEAKRMFGNKWKRVTQEEDNLFQGLVSLVDGSFRKFLGAT